MRRAEARVNREAGRADTTRPMGTAGRAGARGPRPPLWSGMSKQYLITLTEDERAALGQRVRSGRGSARELTHARILLKADSGPNAPGWTDGATATWR